VARGGRDNPKKRSGVPATVPLPMIPTDCDLGDLPSIMLDRTIGKSDLAALSTGDEFKAAILLYIASYDQTPAGSLPDDDRILAFLSSAGPRWAKVRAMALRGWVLCSDRRLYHRVTAEKVLYAWIGRLRQRLASGHGNRKQHGHDFDQAAIEAQIVAAIAAFEAIAPASHELARLKRTTSRKAPGGNPGGTPDGTREAFPPRSQAKGKAEAEGVEEYPSQEATRLVVVSGAGA
jgi:hypothetical protein